MESKPSHCPRSVINNDTSSWSGTLSAVPSLGSRSQSWLEPGRHSESPPLFISPRKRLLDVSESLVSVKERADLRASRWKKREV